MKVSTSSAILLLVYLLALWSWYSIGSLWLWAKRQIGKMHGYNPLISCFTSFWCRLVPIQVSRVMEVTKKVSESMNMFSGGSNGKNNICQVSSGWSADDADIVKTSEPCGLDAKIEKESESNEGGTMWRDKQDSRIAFRKRIVSWAATSGRSSSQGSKHKLVCLWEAPNNIIGKWLSWAIDLLVWFLRLRKRENRTKRAPCGMKGKWDLGIALQARGAPECTT